MRKLIFLLAIAFVSVQASAAETQVKFYGHAAFSVTTPKGHVLFIDPWVSNPSSGFKDEKDALAKISKADYILVTHGHSDHVGDSVALAKKTGAKLVTGFDLGNNMARVLGFPQAQMGYDTLGNIGGELKLADGEVTVTMVPAVHASSLDWPETGEAPKDASKAQQPLVYGGNPMGFVIQVAGGPTIYHTGDTAYFRDMEVIGQTFAPDLALINIGGHFGMEPPMAAKAAQAVRAKLVVPHHYKTFPVLTQDAGPFFKMLDKARIAHREMAPGDVLTFEGKKAVVKKK